MSSFDKSPAFLQDAAPTPPALTHRQPADKPEQQSLVFSADPSSAYPQKETPDEVIKPPAQIMVRSSVPERLWLCIYLPALAFETVVRAKSGHAHAVFAEEQGIRRILLVNKKAAAAGITPGMSINAALSLLSDLNLEERNPGEEGQVLKRLAAWIEQFTSFVSIEAPQGLLLEIGGSLRLFDGVAALRRRIANGFEEQGFTTHLAIAPTPLASTWLAKAGREICIDRTSSLNGHLSTLPLHCLGWPGTVTESLGGMGITCVGDCLRLPREGFARRFGAGRLLQLDRALGRLPDPRLSYRSAEKFCALHDLEEEQNDSELLLHVCRALLLKLEQFLLTRQIQVQRVQFSFFHLRAQVTHLVVGSVQAGRNVDRWFELLRIKLDRTTLPEPVIAIRLRGGSGQALSAATDTLLFDQSAKTHDTSIDRLVERLSARMGDASVSGVTTVAEHRPHYAWRAANVPGQMLHCASVASVWNEHQVPSLLEDMRHTNNLLLRRPLWMLEDPKRLAIEQNHPLYQGRLTMVDGPERLESGWWDDDGIARDYFVALTTKGMHLWIYQDRTEKADWYLHGIFG